MTPAVHSNHPGEYRPFGYDTAWCSICDKPYDRASRPGGTCDDHCATPGCSRTRRWPSNPLNVARYCRDCTAAVMAGRR